jgi:peptide subunit release factor 1 (eRF1)
MDKSISTNNDNIQNRYKLKKLIKYLNDQKSIGTSMVTLTMSNTDKIPNIKTNIINQL